MILRYNTSSSMNTTLPSLCYITFCAHFTLFCIEPFCFPYPHIILHPSFCFVPSCFAISSQRGTPNLTSDQNCVIFDSIQFASFRSAAPSSGDKVSNMTQFWSDVKFSVSFYFLDIFSEHINTLLYYSRFNYFINQFFHTIFRKVSAFITQSPPLIVNRSEK